MQTQLMCALLLLRHSHLGPFECCRYTVRIFRFSFTCGKTVARLYLLSCALCVWEDEKRQNKRISTFVWCEKMCQSWDRSGKLVTMEKWFFSVGLGCNEFSAVSCNSWNLVARRGVGIEREVIDSTMVSSINEALASANKIHLVGLIATLKSELTTTNELLKIKNDECIDAAARLNCGKEKLAVAQSRIQQLKKNNAKRMKTVRLSRKLSKFSPREFIIFRLVFQRKKLELNLKTHSVEEADYFVSIKTLISQHLIISI